MTAKSITVIIQRMVDFFIRLYKYKQFYLIILTYLPFAMGSCFKSPTTIPKKQKSEHLQTKNIFKSNNSNGSNQIQSPPIHISVAFTQTEKGFQVQNSNIKSSFWGKNSLSKDSYVDILKSKNRKKTGNKNTINLIQIQSQGESCTNQNQQKVIVNDWNTEIIDSNPTNSKLITYIITPSKITEQAPCAINSNMQIIEQDELDQESVQDSQILINTSEKKSQNQSNGLSFKNNKQEQLFNGDSKVSLGELEFSLLDKLQDQKESIIHIEESSSENNQYQYRTQSSAYNQNKSSHHKVDNSYQQSEVNKIQVFSNQEGSNFHPVEKQNMFYRSIKKLIGQDRIQNDKRYQSVFINESRFKGFIDSYNEQNSQLSFELKDHNQRVEPQRNQIPKQEYSLNPEFSSSKKKFMYLHHDQENQINF